MKLVHVASLSVACCLALACSDSGEDAGTLGGSAGVGGGGAAPVAGNNAGGSSSGAAGSPTTAGSGTTGGTGGVSGGTGGTGGAAMAGSGGNGGSGGGAIPTDGPGLYTYYCAMCHGEQGNGSMNGPDIKHPIRDYSTWVVRNGRAQTTFPKPMEKWGTEKLSDAQLTLIFDYLDTPPQPPTGPALFADYCLNCHGSDGKSGPVMKNIVMELGELKEQVRKGAHAGEYDMRKEFMPVFTTMRLSDADVQMIYDYVDSL